MLKYIIVFIAGGIFFTVGFSGVARLLDRGVETIKTQSKELAQ